MKCQRRSLCVARSGISVSPLLARGLLTTSVPVLAGREPLEPRESDRNANGGCIDGHDDPVRAFPLTSEHVKGYHAQGENGSAHKAANGGTPPVSKDGAEEANQQTADQGAREISCEYLPRRGVEMGFKCLPSIQAVHEKGEEPERDSQDQSPSHRPSYVRPDFPS